MADVSAMGAVMIPMMKKEGYHADYAVNVTTHAALVGALMPTSHNMIIYALAAGGTVSIGSLIAAGLLPALVLTICMLVAAYLVAVKRGYPAGTFPGLGRDLALDGRSGAGPADRRHHPGRASSPASSRLPKPPSIAVIYTILLTFFVYRTMTMQNFLKAAAKAVKTTGVVLLLIGVSTMFQYLMGLYEVADIMGDADRQPVDHALGRLPADQRHPVRPRHVHGHGDHDPHLHADLPADRHEVRHGPGAVRHGDADQLRAGPQYAAGRHGPVRRLRDRRRSRWAR